MELEIVEVSGGLGTTSSCGMRFATLDCGESVVVVSLVERGWDIFEGLMLLGRVGTFGGGLGIVLMIWEISSSSSESESYLWRRGGMSMSLSESSSQSVSLWVRDGSVLCVDELLI